MAYLQARANIARAGVTYAGYTTPNVVVYLAGTDRTSSILMDGFSITNRSQNTPATCECAMSVNATTPVVGNDLLVTYATPNMYLFGGTILQAEARPFNAVSNKVRWHCTASGYDWQMNRYDLVLAEYYSTGVGTILADILYRFTDGGFRVGYCPESLGNLSMTFTYETVTGAITRLASACGEGVVWRLTIMSATDKVIDLFDTYPETALDTLAAADVIVERLTYRPDLSQVRTRSIQRGAGSTLAEAAAAGATSITVEDTTPFLDAGGQAQAGRSLITYTGRSVGSGLGTLTGVTGLLYDVPAQESIDLVVITTDSAAATALATRLGGSLSGQATAYASDGRISATEAAGRGAADVSVFGGPLDEVTWALVDFNKEIHVGMTQAIAIAAPIAISGDYVIDSVTLTPRGKIGGASVNVDQECHGSRFAQTLTDFLRKES